MRKWTQNALALITGVTIGTTALAHSKAEETLPVNDTTVTALEIIEIHFDDPMRVTAISLTGPSGAVDVARQTGMDAVTEFRARPSGDLPAGPYTVEWRGLSSDGHPMQGRFGFTLAE